MPEAGASNDRWQVAGTSLTSRFLLGTALLNNGDAPAAEIELTKARDLRYSDERVVPHWPRRLRHRASSARSSTIWARWS